MIQNKTALRLLYLSSVWLECRPFSVVNKFIQLSYLKIVIPLLNMSCSVARLEPRHSLLSKVNFNAALSDIDISAYVLDGEEQKITGARQFYLNAKSVLIFLGEIEIYTELEKKILDELNKSIGDIYTSLRHFRKIWWMQYSLQTAPSLYHRHKASRALSISLNKINQRFSYSHENPLPELNMELEKLIEVTLPQIAKTVQHSPELPLKIVDCPYMGAKIKLSRDSEWTAGLSLSPKVALVLMSITPVAYGGSEEHELIIQNLRKRSDVYEIWKKLTAAEILIFQAFMRGFAVKEEWMYRWQKTLLAANDEVQKFNSK